MQHKHADDQGGKGAARARTGDVEYFMPVSSHVIITNKHTKGQGETKSNKNPKNGSGSVSINWRNQHGCTTQGQAANEQEKS